MGEDGRIEGELEKEGGSERVIHSASVCCMCHMPAFWLACGPCEHM